MQYRIYTNDGAGGPVDESTPIATVAGPPFVPDPLPPNSDRTWIVHAFDPVTGQEDRHVDARFRQVTGPAGEDLSGLPSPPVGVSASPAPGGTAVVRWKWLGIGKGPRPTQFRVYAASPSLPAPGPGPTAPLGIAPVATAPWAGADVLNSVPLPGLGYGWSGQILVRAANAAGEEGNLFAVNLTLPQSPPSAPDPVSAEAVP